MIWNKGKHGDWHHRRDESKSEGWVEQDLRCKTLEWTASIENKRLSHKRECTTVGICWQSIVHFSKCESRLFRNGNNILFGTEPRLECGSDCGEVLGVERVYSREKIISKQSCFRESFKKGAVRTKKKYMAHHARFLVVSKFDWGSFEQLTSNHFWGVMPS